MKTVKEHGLERIVLERGDRVEVRTEDDRLWTIEVEEDDGIMVMLSAHGVVTVTPQASNVVHLGARKSGGGEGVIAGRGLRANAGKPDFDEAMKHVRGLCYDIHGLTPAQLLEKQVKTAIAAVWPW